MLFSNPLLAQEMARERMDEALREAEQARLTWVAECPRKSRGWRAAVALTLSSLLALFIRPQSRQIPQGGRK